MGLTVPLLAILLIGLMARNFVGRWLLEFGEGTLSKIPVAGAVYKTLKQLLETFLSNKSNRFRRVVLVEYPREGLYSVGFVTGDVGPSLQPELNEKLLSVLYPQHQIQLLDGTLWFLKLLLKIWIFLLKMLLEQ